MISRIVKRFVLAIVFTVAMPFIYAGMLFLILGGYSKEEFDNMARNRLRK